MDLTLIARKRLVTIDLGDGSVADTRWIFDGINRIYRDILNHEGHEVLIADFIDLTTDFTDYTDFLLQ